MEAISWPFIGTEALSARAIPERALRTRYRQLYPGVFVPLGADPTAAQRARAAWLWSKRNGVLAGQSAAVLLGAKWVDGSHPAELVHSNRKAPPRLIVRSEDLTDSDAVRIGDLTVTSAARTAFDIGRHVPSRGLALQRLDALANATRITRADVEAVIGVHPGARGLRRLRALLPLIDGGAESPQETSARLALIDAGLPAPATQIRVLDSSGTFVARLDMGYEDAKVGIEYDGAQHWTDPAIRQRDIDRRYALTDLGWLVVHVSHDLLRYRRATFVRRVEQALHTRRSARDSPRDAR